MCAWSDRPSVCRSFGSHALVFNATTVVAAAAGYRVWSSSAGRAEYKIIVDGEETTAAAPSSR